MPLRRSGDAVRLEYTGGRLRCRRGDVSRARVARHTGYVVRRLALGMLAGVIAVAMSRGASPLPIPQPPEKGLKERAKVTGPRSCRNSAFKPRVCNRGFARLYFFRAGAGVVSHARADLGRHRIHVRTHLVCRAVWHWHGRHCVPRRRSSLAAQLARLGGDVRLGSVANRSSPTRSAIDSRCLPPGEPNRRRASVN